VPLGIKATTPQQRKYVHFFTKSLFRKIDSHREIPVLLYKCIVPLTTQALQGANKMEDACFVLVYWKNSAGNLLSYSFMAVTLKPHWQKYK
jgi:hypothetical protein